MMTFMRLSCYIILIFLFSPHALRAQEGLDSLKILGLIDQAENTYLNDPDLALALVTDAFAQAEELDSEYLKGRGHFVLMKIHWSSGKYSLSTAYGYMAAAEFRNISNDYESGRALLGVARNFIDIDDFKEAKRVFNKLKPMVTTGSGLEVSYFRELSLLHLRIRQYDSSLYFIDKGLPLSASNADPVSTSIFHSRKGVLYYLLGEYEKSIEQHKIGVKLDSTLKNYRGLGISSLGVARSLFKLKKYEDARKMAQNSIELSSRFNAYHNLIDAHRLMADILEFKGQAYEALQEMKLAFEAEQGHDDFAQSNWRAELNAIRALEEKNKEFYLLQKENELRTQELKGQQIFLTVLILALVLLGVSVILLWRLRKNQNYANQLLTFKNKAIERQKEELQKQKERLQEINQQKTAIMALIGHDLRGPVGNLQTILDMVTQKILTNEDFLALADKIKGTLSVSRHTLENLLNWSLHQMEGIVTDIQRLNIVEQVDESCRLLEDLAEKKGIKIERNMSSPTYAYADKDQLLIILRNLIQNAIKFSRENGSVLINETSEKGFLKIAITDFGMGMSDKEVEKLLKADHVISKRGTQQEKGTGLGIKLCKDLIKKNNGILEVTSVAGEFTKVIVSLPKEMTVHAVNVLQGQNQV